MKKSEDKSQKGQDEESQRKTSKLIAYISSKSENCKIEQAMLNQRIK